MTGQLISLANVVTIRPNQLAFVRGTVLFGPLVLTTWYCDVLWRLPI